MTVDIFINILHRNSIGLSLFQVVIYNVESENLSMNFSDSVTLQLVYLALCMDLLPIHDFVTSWLVVQKMSSSLLLSIIKNVCFPADLKITSIPKLQYFLKILDLNITNNTFFSLFYLKSKTHFNNLQENVY